MADSFFPVNFKGAPVVALGKQTYGIAATIFNPDTNAQMTVPDHVWSLLVGVGKGTSVARSSPSFLRGGVCTIGADKDAAPPGEYSFLLSPFPSAKTYTPAEAKAILDGFVADRQSWIDLDKPDRWAVPPNPRAIERRRLLRVPVWSTRRKAPIGSFKVIPPNTTQFATQGFIPREELADFGLKTPWDMPLDFNWIRARIKFSFFDWQQNKEETLPPGLIIDALRDIKKNGQLVTTRRIGSGISASLKDGTSFMFVEGDKSMWKETHITFQTPGSCFIDLSSKATPTPDTRMSNGQRPAAGDDFNRLPAAWHSHGMRASFTTSPRNTPAAATPPTADKIWDQLHFDLAADQNGHTTTVNFHLDDVVICDSNGVPVAFSATSKPPTLFDHFLSIIKPKPNIPYQTDMKLVGRVIPAPVAYAVPGKSASGDPKILEQSTRLIHFESAFHDLRDDRVKGTIGQTLCVGARAALDQQHLSEVVDRPIVSRRNSRATLGLQMHLIDVPGVLDPATKVQLLHLLIFISAELEINPDKPPQKPVNLDDLRQILNTSAETWSPGHPGTQSPVKAKRYALVPSDRTKRIIRFRVFFAESSKQPKLKISVTDGGSTLRANTDGSKDPVLLFFDGLPQTTIVYFDSALNNDKTAAFGQRKDAGDGVSNNVCILTHELGHALGLMDEYAEDLDPKMFGFGFQFQLTDPRLPQFGQIDEGFSDWRPYYSDMPATMKFNGLPRLRYFWHHAKNLNDKFPKLADKPYALVHEAFTDSSKVDELNYSVAPSNSKPPWESIFEDVTIPAGRGKIALFPLGEDEGTVEAMFLPPNLRVAQPGLPRANRMDGVLLVRSRIGFIFDPAMTGAEKLDVLSLNFHNKIYDLAYAPKIRFAFVSSKAAQFRRIAVLLHPLYGVADDLTPSDTLKAGAMSTSDLLSQSDIVFDISKTAKPPRPNPFLGRIRGRRVNVMLSDFTFELAMRVVLGIGTVFPDGITLANGALIPGDFKPLASLVDQQLGEAGTANARTVVPYT